MDLSSLLASFAAAFNQDQRLLSLHFAEGRGPVPETLLPHVLEGEAALSKPYVYTLECLSADAGLELKSLLGLAVEVDIHAADGGTQVLTGVVSKVKSLGSDGGFARYGLTIEPPLALLRHRKTSRVFQDLSVVDIVKAIIAEHQANNPLLAASFALQFDLAKTYPPRSYCLQYRESDLDFIQRLLAEEGIAYRFAFAGGDAAKQAPGGGTPYTTMIGFDDPYQLDAAAQSKVRFHRADATEEADTITGWDSKRQLGTSKVSLASFDYKPVSTSTADDDSAVDHGDGGRQASQSLEDYDPQTLYYGSDGEDLGRYAQLRQQANDRLSKQFSGEGTVRQFNVGEWFQLDNHPAHDFDAPEDRQFTITRQRVQARNNLPGDLVSQLSKAVLGSPAETTNPANDAPFRTDFDAQRRGIPLTPDYQPYSKPTSRGVQTATVVGPQGGSADSNSAGEVHTDELGRIKVQFHWQRTQEHPEYGASLDDKSSCWLRVAMPSAGAGWGHQFIPRVGQEVLVDFLEGDIDRPLVTGVVYNGSHPVPAFSGAGSLPANKTLSGIKTKEHGGGQYGELLFDDTQGEVRTKLSSEHGKTQLNQGFLIHPRSDGKGTPRGEGFELRTDRHGAIRAGQGLLISTEAANGAGGNQLDRSQAQSQLDAAFELASSLGEVATHQLADTVETGPETIKDNAKAAKTQQGHLHHLKEALESWANGSNTAKDGKGDQPGQQALIVVSAPAGLAQTTPNSQAIAAGSNLDLIALRDTQQTSGRRWIHNVGEHISLFVSGVKDQIALKLIAAKGKVQVQAQSDSVDINAAKDLAKTANQKVTVNAGQEILLTSGGAYIRIKGGNIEIHAPGKIDVKGASHSFDGPASANSVLPAFPQKDRKNFLELTHSYPDLRPVPGAPYVVHFADGSQLQGKLDDKGYARLENVPEGPVSIYYGEDPRPYQPNAAFPPNPITGAPNSVEDALSRLAKREKMYADFWSQQATSEQRDYISELNGMTGEHEDPRTPLSDEPAGEALEDFLDDVQRAELAAAKESKA
ncbi:type VI secretion system Vgr family protein [Jeongeupia sp. USM3]|uniref:type VI secretion system Vgr family protein n=1 Tax=Jeongeupia sp. USM3 TaxID=1906741 RepID=UPI0009F729BD|nr:type VI secretion system Vgr family protein [Jeongeupia sp. USM3]